MSCALESGHSSMAQVVRKTALFIQGQDIVLHFIYWILCQFWSVINGDAGCALCRGWNGITGLGNGAFYVGYKVCN